MIMYIFYKINEIFLLLNFLFISDFFLNFYKYFFIKGKCFKFIFRCICKLDIWNNEYKNFFFKIINIFENL